MAVAIRATDERTLPLLKEQLSRQIANGDCLKVFNEAESFVHKMERVFAWCIGQGKSISLIVDADILLRPGAVPIIRRQFRQTPAHYSGFGVQVFDRFFQRPKFRGLHVYRTAHLAHYREGLPAVQSSLRPETDLKKIVAQKGFPHSNEQVKFYVAGLHDYYQWYRDIYFKMMVRSHRSPEQIDSHYFPRDESYEYYVAEKGLAAGQKRQDISLNKLLIDMKEDWPAQQELQEMVDVETKIRQLLKKHYGNNLFYLAAKNIWAEGLLQQNLKWRRKL